MLQECPQHFFQIKQLGLALHEGDAIYAKNALQLCLGIQVIEYHLTGITAPDLDYHPQTILVGFVAQLADAFYPLFFDQLGYLFDQPRLIELERNFGNYDLFPTLGVGFDLGTTAHIDPAPSGTVGLNDACSTVDDAAGRKVWPLNMLHQVINTDILIFQDRQAGVNDLG